MFQIVFGLVFIGVALWLICTYIPMAAPIRAILTVVVVICVIFWLANVFGLMGHDIPVPRLRR